MILNEKLEFAPNVYVQELVAVKENIETLSGRMSIDIYKLAGEIYDDPSRIHYLSSNMGFRDASAKDSRYVYIDTGYKTENDEHIIISTVKAREGYFIGFFVGTPVSLIKHVLKYTDSDYNTVLKNVKKLIARLDGEKITKTTSDDAKEAKSEEKTIIADIENNLLLNPFLTQEGFAKFLRVIGSRLSTLIEQNKTEYYILNKSKYAIVNSGLLDKFSQDILIMYQYHQNENTYYIHKVISSKQDMLDELFDIDATKTKLKAINFFDEDDSISSNIDDYDITTYNLTHILQERKERFDEILGERRPDELALIIESELKRSLTLLAIDKSYAKPFYSSKTKKVAWLLPLRINRSLAEEPEFVLVISRCGVFYQVKTVYAYNDACKDRITALSLYSKSW